MTNFDKVYRLIWQKPVATDPWNEETEGADAANWAQGFINSWKSPLPILVGGSYAVPSVIQPGWPNTDYLIDTAYNETIKAATKAYNSHIYRFFGNETTLPNEMNHASTVKDLVPFANSVAKAKSVGRRHFIGTRTRPLTYCNPCNVIDQVKQTFTQMIQHRIARLGRHLQLLTNLSELYH